MPLEPAARLRRETGWRYGEINTILRRINRRADMEPTPKERERMMQLRQEIADLKKGKKSYDMEESSRDSTGR